MLQCVGINEIYQISNSQAQSAYDAFYYVCNAHPKDIIPRRGLITGANIQHFFDMSKEMSIILKIECRIYWFMVWIYKKIATYVRWENKWRRYLCL